MHWFMQIGVEHMDEHWLLHDCWQIGWKSDFRRGRREGERRTNLEKDSLLLNTRVLARRLADGRARLDDSRGRGAA